MSDEAIILLNIESVETKIINGTDDNGNPTKTAKMSIKDVSGKKYSYFVSEADGNFGQSLQAGNRVYVYFIEKKGEWRGKPITYRNIYKPRDPVPPVPAVNEKGIPVSPPPVLPDKTPEPPPGFYEETAPISTRINVPTDKDTKIRWMNAMNNAVQIVAGLDLKKLGQPEIQNYIIDYAHFFNTLEADMTEFTYPIGKAQIIRLHNLMTDNGISKLFYHKILSKILGKTIAKTTDLSYREATKCIEKFDETLKSENASVAPPEGDEEQEKTWGEEDNNELSDLPF